MEGKGVGSVVSIGQPDEAGDADQDKAEEYNPNCTFT